eukprot:13132-Eustigmatos_ZCMA.PRE.1
MNHASWHSRRIEPMNGCACSCCHMRPRHIIACRVSQQSNGGSASPHARHTKEASCGKADSSFDS